ncbi:MAG: hypothetical protein LBM21_00710 [Coriobacteriales bacterium]|jgi:glucose-6-phosphate isomerase|nr:hypothetical protein [Coriobacteriales bacterium]
MSQENNIDYDTCLDELLAVKAPSRIGAKDSTLYAQIPGAQDFASKFMGWADLASDPPFSLNELKAVADGIKLEGLNAVVLIGQGGSSQAPMTITKLNEVALCGNPEVEFRTMDSLSPVFVNHILGSSDPAHTLYIVSSKSGSTLEPLSLEKVAWQYVTGHLGTEGAAKRFVAITDPGSGLEAMAHEKGYRFVLPGCVDVGGRFSALSVFALFPAALVGIDLVGVQQAAADMQARCTQDTADNPAAELAAFLYGNYLAGRDKLSLVMPSTGQVFGLWLEQIIAESLGKDGKGILPNVEVDASILALPHDDRCAITYDVGRVKGFGESVSHFDKGTPVKNFSLCSIDDVFAQFVLWEYAIAFLGLLMQTDPFDQPDVEDTKKRVRELLANPHAKKTAADDYLQIDMSSDDYIKTVRISNALLESDCGNGAAAGADEALRSLLSSIKHGDYFSLNAFLPFRGYGRREALERIRNRVASRLGAAACLEIGPRYLHSTGQLHKGGPNTGVFLYISAGEDNDISVPGEDFTLGALATTQARGDFEALCSRGRRAVAVHLASNGSETLSRFADRVCAAVSACCN